MARDLTPRDAHALINAICKEATGQEPDIQAVDTSTFVSVGEKILATGTENTLNAISTVIGRTFMAVRPYSSKFGMLEEVDTALFKNRVRKISFYSQYALESGDWNTQLYTNLKDGYDNGTNGGDSTKSMWTQVQGMPLELNFAGLSTFQDGLTVYRDQLKVAFTDEDTFNSFVAGILTEKGNDIEVQREAFRRMTLLNQIAAAYSVKADYPTMAVNLTAGFNAKFGTSYSSAQLRTTYLKEFLEYLVATIKQLSRRMTYRTASFHMPYTKTVSGVEYNVLRHTPRDRQRLFLYSPLLIDAEAMVMPEIFNDNYLKIENYEGVDFWQNFINPAEVKVKPALPGDAGTQIAGDTVDIPYVVGCLFDRDAILVNNYLEDSLATPVEARKRYYNIWWTFARNAINDLSENFILLYMEDAAPASQFAVTPSTVTATAASQELTATLSNIPEGTNSIQFGDKEIPATLSDNEGTITIEIDSDATSADNNSYVVDIKAVDSDLAVLATTSITVVINIPEG